MARVLVYTSPARGHLYPIVPIVQELLAREHEVPLHTLGSQVATLRMHGIDARPIAPEVERVELEDYRARSAAMGGVRALSTFATRARHEAPDLQRALAQHDPDGLLIDIHCWGAATVAQVSGLPWAMYSPYLLMLPSRETPPFGLGLRPRTDMLGAARDALVRRMSQVALDRAVTPRVNRLRAHHCLPVLRHFQDVFAEPSLLLALTAEGFEYPRSDWPANVRLVGPTTSWSPPEPESESEWLADIGDPLVLATCSTEHQHDRRLVQVALDALPAAGMSVIVTTASHDPTTLRVPAGSHAVRFAAHEPILERAACVVCHGGMGITQKALASAIPVVVVPFGRDQLETARRVEHAGAGVRLSPRRLTPKRLLAAVRSAMTECREGALQVSRAYRAAGGESAAADALEDMLGCARLAHPDFRPYAHLHSDPAPA